MVIQPMTYHSSAARSEPIPSPHLSREISSQVCLGAPPVDFGLVALNTSAESCNLCNEALRNESPCCNRRGVNQQLAAVSIVMCFEIYSMPASSPCFLVTV